MESYNSLSTDNKFRENTFQRYLINGEPVKINCHEYCATESLKTGKYDGSKDKRSILNPS